MFNTPPGATYLLPTVTEIIGVIIVDGDLVLKLGQLGSVTQGHPLLHSYEYMAPIMFPLAQVADDFPGSDNVAKSHFKTLLDG